MKIGPEDSISIVVKEFCDLNKIPLFKIAGERKCSIIYGRLLKQMGVIAGVSDFFFPRGNDQFKGMFLELKAGKNVPTELQRKFMLSMELEGYYCPWTQGIDKALEVICNFYRLRK